MNKPLIGMRIIFGLVGLLALRGSTAFAGVTTGAAHRVQVRVAAGCSISTNLSAVAFSATAGTAAAPASKSAAASIVCTKGTPYDFHMTTTNTFRMKLVNSGTTYFIPYTVTGPNGVLGSTAKARASFGSMGTGLAQSAAFTFAIPAAGWLATNAPGTYVDTATLRVDF